MNASTYCIGIVSLCLVTALPLTMGCVAQPHEGDLGAEDPSALKGDEELAKAGPCFCPAVLEPVVCLNGQIYDNQCEADCAGQPAVVDLVERGDFGDALAPLDPTALPFSQSPTAPGYQYVVGGNGWGNWYLPNQMSFGGLPVWDHTFPDSDFGNFMKVQNWASQSKPWIQYNIPVVEDREYHASFAALAFDKHGATVPTFLYRAVFSDGTGDSLLAITPAAEGNWYQESTTWVAPYDDVITLYIREQFSQRPEVDYGLDDIAFTYDNCRDADEL